MGSEDSRVGTRHAWSRVYELIFVGEQVKRMFCS